MQIEIIKARLLAIQARSVVALQAQRKKESGNQAISIWASFRNDSLTSLKKNPKHSRGKCWILSESQINTITGLKKQLCSIWSMGRIRTSQTSPSPKVVTKTWWNFALSTGRKVWSKRTWTKAFPSSIAKTTPAPCDKTKSGTASTSFVTAQKTSTTKKSCALCLTKQWPLWSFSTKKWAFRSFSTELPEQLTLQKIWLWILFWKCFWGASCWWISDHSWLRFSKWSKLENKCFESWITSLSREITEVASTWMRRDSS